MRSSPDVLKDNAEIIIRVRSYHVSFHVVDYDPKKHVLTLRKIGEDPSDSGCQREGQLYLELCSLEGKTVKVFVTGERPMSAKNPIDYEWARELASGFQPRRDK